jgi:hypothetical protein
MVAALLSLWACVAPASGPEVRPPAPSRVAGAAIGDGRQVNAWAWPVDDEGSTGPRRGQCESILTEQEEAGDGDPIAAVAPGFRPDLRARGLGRLAIDPARALRTPPSDRSRVLRC